MFTTMNVNSWHKKISCLSTHPWDILRHSCEQAAMKFKQYVDHDYVAQTEFQPNYSLQALHIDLQRWQEASVIIWLLPTVNFWKWNFGINQGLEKIQTCNLIYAELQSICFNSYAYYLPNYISTSWFWTYRDVK